MAELYSDNPELAAEQEGILKRRRIAELMQQQSMQPIDTPQPQRGFAVPTSMGAGIAKVLQAYMASKGIKEADAAQAGLSTKATGMENAAVDSYMKSRADTVAPYPINNQMSPEAQQFAQTDGQQITPKTPQELDQANLGAQTSNYGKLRVAGALQAKLDEAAKNDAREAASKKEAARLAAESKADAARIAADAKLQSERERREMMMLLAGNKTDAAQEKAQVKIDAGLEKKTNAAKLASKSFDDLIFKINELVDKDGNPLPGFTSAFGQIDAMYPNFMKFDKTSKAYKNLESIQAQETMRGLSDAKEQVGQSFGSMQVKEWDRFTNLVRSLDPSQPDKSSLLPNLINLRNEAIKEKEALQSQIGSGQAQPTPPSGKTIVREVKLKDGRTGVEYSDGSRGYK